MFPGARPEHAARARMSVSVPGTETDIASRSTAMSYHPAAADAHTPFQIPSGTPDRADEVTLLGDQVATMRDGVRLGADVYLPAGLGPVPAIMLRVPYGRRTPDMSFDVQGAFFARKGYACVIQDVRGKFSSEGDLRPGCRRGRRRLRLRRLGGGAALVRRPHRPLGRVVLRLHVVGGGDQRARGDPRDRARRHRSRPAAIVVPPGRPAPEHDGLLGDGDGRPRVRRPDGDRPVAPAAGRNGAGGRARGPLLRRDPGARRGRRLVAAPERAAAAGRGALPGAVLGRLVRQLPRPAAHRPRDRARPPSRARDGAPDGRAVGSRGVGRAHRPRRLRAAAAHRAAPLGRLPGVLRPLPPRRGQRLRPRRPRRPVHDRAEHLAPRAVVAAARDDRDARVPARRRRAHAGRPGRRRGARRVRVRPARPGGGDRRRQLLGALHGARRPARAGSTAPTSSATSPSRSPTTSS